MVMNGSESRDDRKCLNVKHLSEGKSLDTPPATPQVV
jgi:hypothetical protein